MNKLILITGATSGMGKVTAEDLIKAGHIVYGAGRKEEELKSIQDLGGKGLVMEMTDYSTLETGVEEIIREHGKIDVLWNNAGYGLYGPVEEVSIEQAKQQFEVNLFGLARLTQLVLPHMRKENKGLIINTSSMGGKIYTPLGAWYHATKHALEGWSDCLRLELKSFNIDVVVLEPGMIDTGFGSAVAQHMPKDSANGPYKKIIEPLLNMDPNAIKASPPSVISQTVQKIISAEKPKTRYVAGKMARFLIYTRKLFGDRLYDRIIMSQFK